MTEQNQKKTAERKGRQSQPARVEQKPGVSERVVFMGQKPVKNVVACLTSFSSGSDRIVMKARGRTICKAVDAVELLRRAFVRDLQLEGINTCTEQLAREGARRTYVSAIEITVVKP